MCERIMKIRIVMYHYTRDLMHSRYPKIHGLDASLFEEQLQFFKSQFEVVDMESVIEAVHGGKLPKNAILLTFDDGYIDNYTVAMPLLKKYGMQGSFFIPGKTFSEHKVLDVNKVHFILATAPEDELKSRVRTLIEEYRYKEDFPSYDELYLQYAVASRYDTGDIVFVKRMLQTVLPDSIRRLILDRLFKEYIGISEECFSRELYMNADQIRCLRDNGMYIGIHGYDHNRLGVLSKEEMVNDLEKALDVMDPFIDNDNWVMNYPYGSYNDDVISFIESNGCSMGLSTTVGMAEINDQIRFMLPRLNCNDFPPKSEEYRKFE